MIWCGFCGKLIMWSMNRIYSPSCIKDIKYLNGEYLTVNRLNNYYPYGSMSLPSFSFNPNEEIRTSMYPMATRHLIGSCNLVAAWRLRDPPIQLHVIPIRLASNRGWFLMNSMMSCTWRNVKLMIANCQTICTEKFKIWWRKISSLYIQTKWLIDINHVT